MHLSVAFVLLGPVPNWPTLLIIDFLQLVCMLNLASRALIFEMLLHAHTALDVVVLMQFD